MIIKRLTLTNIKSYEYEVIDFSQGINCILGLNGSGKSTIIESIGIALFNFIKTKNIGDVLRYNETKGAIEIEFVAENNTTYRIIRNIKKKSSTVKIIEVNNDTELYSNVADVYSFVKKELNVSNNKDFSKMFGEIIAVPQGSFVSAFLEKPSVRKDTFDKLLELDIYKDINLKLKGLDDCINKNRISPLKEEIANIDGKLTNYDSIKNDIKSLEKNIKENQNELEKNNKLLEESLAIYNEQTKLKEELEKEKNSKIINENKIKNLENTIQEIIKNLDKSKDALSIVNQTKNEYEKYLKNDKKINELEEDLIKLNQLNETYNSLKIELIKLENEYNNLINKIDKKEAEKVDKKKQYFDKNQEELLNKNNVEKNEEKYQKLRLIFEEKDKENKQKKEQQIMFENSYKMYQKRYEKDNVFCDKNLNKNKQKIAEIDAKNEAIKIAKIEIKKLDKNETILEEKIKSLIVNSKMAVDGKCPIFNSKCLNIKEDSLCDYFDHEINKVNLNLGKIKEEKERLEKIILEEDSLLALKHNLENENYLIETSERTLSELKKELLESFNIFNIDTSLDLLNIFNVINDILIENEKIINDQEKELKIKQEELTRLRTLVDSENFKIESNKNYLDTLDKEIKNINNELVFDKEGLELIYENKNSKSKEIKKIEEKIAYLNDSKERLEEIKKEQNLLEENKNKYIANLNKSMEVEELEENYNNRTNEIKDYKGKICENIEKIESLDKLFSNKALDSSKIDSTKYSNNKTRLETLSQEYEKKYQELMIKERELIELKSLKEEKNNELINLNNISEFLVEARTIYKELPLKLSKTYREYLAKVSTVIYREISSENVRLEIKEDYEVNIVDDFKPSNTKTMEYLSGGEQMSVAIAIRLAMLKHIAGVNIYFLDEPTINLDYERREKVADVAKEISKSLSQLFVISHDDTFENITTNTIKIEKNNNISSKY